MQRPCEKESSTDDHFHAFILLPDCNVNHILQPCILMTLEKSTTFLIRPRLDHSHAFVLLQSVYSAYQVLLTKYSNYLAFKLNTIIKSCVQTRQQTLAALKKYYPSQRGLCFQNYFRACILLCGVAFNETRGNLGLEHHI